MSESKREPSGGQSVFCVRNKVLKPPEEHLTCPYCFGRRREAVAGGDHALFCDYDESKDPLAFGFPEASTRSLKG